MISPIAAAASASPRSSRRTSRASVSGQEKSPIVGSKDTGSLPAYTRVMRIAVGGDERNDVTDHVLETLRKRGHELIKVIGPVGGSDEQWADVGRGVAESVASGDADQGIVFCWTGTGVSLAATRSTVPGRRCAPMPSKRAAPAAGTTRTCSRCSCGLRADRWPTRSSTRGSPRPSSTPPRCRTSTRSSEPTFRDSAPSARVRVPPEKRVPLAYRSRARSFFAVIAFLSRIATSASSQQQCRG